MSGTLVLVIIVAMMVSGHLLQNYGFWLIPIMGIAFKTVCHLIITQFHNLTNNANMLALTIFSYCFRQFPQHLCYIYQSGTRLNTVRAENFTCDFFFILFLLMRQICKNKKPGHFYFRRVLLWLLQYVQL